jgi:hypothetical protein
MEIRRRGLIKQLNIQSQELVLGVRNEEMD